MKIQPVFGPGDSLSNLQMHSAVGGRWPFLALTRSEEGSSPLPVLQEKQAFPPAGSQPITCRPHQSSCVQRGLRGHWRLAGHCILRTLFVFLLLLGYCHYSTLLTGLLVRFLLKPKPSPLQEAVAPAAPLPQEWKPPTQGMDSGHTA